jgi:hypothetical protein
LSGKGKDATGFAFSKKRSRQDEDDAVALTEEEKADQAASARLREEREDEREASLRLANISDSAGGSTLKPSSRVSYEATLARLLHDGAQKKRKKKSAGVAGEAVVTSVSVAVAKELVTSESGDSDISVSTVDTPSSEAVPTSRFIHTDPVAESLSIGGMSGGNKKKKKKNNGFTVVSASTASRDVCKDDESRSNSGTNSKPSNDIEQDNAKNICTSNVADNLVADGQKKKIGKKQRQKLKQLQLQNQIQN